MSAPKFTISVDQLTKDAEIRSDKGRRVAIVKAMSGEVMTLEYAHVMASALNAYFASKQALQTQDQSEGRVDAQG